MARERRTHRRSYGILGTIALAGMLAVSAPGASAAVNTCSARNLTQNTPSRSNLQRVIDAASPGDRIEVRHVCVGTFTVTEDITLIGEAPAGERRPVLNADGAGRTLLVKGARVRISNLQVTGGNVELVAPGVGGRGAGIAITHAGVLTLKDTIVRGNIGQSTSGGGIYNSDGTLTLNGSSSVLGNTAGPGSGGGIFNRSGIVTLNDSSSVRNNTASSSGGIYNNGIVTLNDSSSVRGNTATGDGGGIGTDGTVTMNDSSSVRGNTADSDGNDTGTGGGFAVSCVGILIGGIDGGNVDNNHRGIGTAEENNIVSTCT